MMSFFESTRGSYSELQEGLWWKSLICCCCLIVCSSTHKPTDGKCHFKMAMGETKWYVILSATSIVWIAVTIALYTYNYVDEVMYRNLKQVQQIDSILYKPVAMVIKI